MAPTDPASVEDITVPFEETEAVDPTAALPPVVLPREVGAGSGPDDAPGATGEASTGRRLFAPARRPGRRVVRIVRHIQLWSVFKIALLGGLVFYGIFLVAAGLGWSIANATGQVHHIEQFMRQVGFESWTFEGAKLFRAAAVIGAIGLVAGSIMITLGAAIVNLISEATGGIRFTVIEVFGSEDDDEVTADDEG